MKKQNSRSRNLYFLLALIAALLSLSFVTTPLVALAPITTGEAFEELTDPIQGEDRVDMETVIGGETAELQTIEIVNTTHLEDGIYAFMNVGNSSGNTKLWMDLQQNNFSSTAHMQQYNTSTIPTESFSRSMLFKVTRVGTTSRYIIRLMMNNLLTFDFDGEYVKTKRIPANDSEVDISDTIVIAYTASGFMFRPYDDSEYICANNTTASGASGAPNSYLNKSSFSAAGNYGRWKIYKYTGTARSGISYGESASLANGLKKGNIAFLSIAVWSTVIGANTPHIEVPTEYYSRAGLLQLSDDTIPENPFLQKYALVIKNSGKYELAYCIKNEANSIIASIYRSFIAIPNITPGVFCIRNTQTKQYMDVEGPSLAEGASIQQWAYSGATQKQWIITPVGEGYYRIQSMYSGLYVGVNSSDTSQIKQYNAINDYTKWYFHEIDDESSNPARYAIICKAQSSSMRGIATPSNADTLGVNLTTVSFPINASCREEWELWPVYYTATIQNAFDLGYSAHYNETTEQSSELINMYTLALSERYLQLLGLSLRLTDDAENIESVIDEYKSEHGGNIDTITPYSNVDSLVNLYSELGSSTETYAYWSCHKIFTGFSSSEEYNRSFSWDTGIYLLKRYSPNSSAYREMYSKALLMHEMNHQYGASDHYHDVVNGVCQNQSFCSDCSETPRDPECIMRKSDTISINNSNVICADCEEEILIHLASHHLISTNNGG